MLLIIQSLLMDNIVSQKRSIKNDHKMNKINVEL